MINISQAQKVGAGRTATIYRYGQNKVAKLYRPSIQKNAIDFNLLSSFFLVKKIEIRSSTA